MGCCGNELLHLGGLANDGLFQGLALGDQGRGGCRYCVINLCPSPGPLGLSYPVKLYFTHMPLGLVYGSHLCGPLPIGEGGDPGSGPTFQPHLKHNI